MAGRWISCRTLDEDELLLRADSIIAASIRPDRLILFTGRLHSRFR